MYLLLGPHVVGLPEIVGIDDCGFRGGRHYWLGNTDDFCRRHAFLLLVLGQTAAPVPLNSVGRATQALVIVKAVSRLTERPRTASTRKYDAIRRKVPVRQRDSGD